MLALLLQPCLFQNTAKCTNRNVQARLPANGNGAWLCRVPKLAVTAARPNELPTIFFEHLNDLANVHQGKAITTMFR